MTLRNLDPLVLTAALVGISAVAFILLTLLLRYYDALRHPARDPLRAVRNVIVPSFLIIMILAFVLKIPETDSAFRTAETIFWCLVIWVIPSFIKSLFFSRADNQVWRARVPELFLDILRFSLITMGVALVLSGVWGRDLGGFFATLGVGSIVIGLALQDTLGNLMAGVALLFERPFQEGDWIQVGDTLGMVHEINWRAVRIYTRSRDLVIVPNSVLAKERIQNYSRPTRAHALELEVSFSYSDPPNKVKQVLIRVAQATRGVLPDGIQIRTLGYLDCAIEYQIHFFINEFDRVPEIREEMMTRVWYAMRRNRLNMPFPIRTVYKTEVPNIQASEDVDEIRGVLRSIDLFAPLSDEEIDALARDAILQEFAEGERVVHQGDVGDTLCVIRNGQARVVVGETPMEEREVAILSAPHCFGEMALLTGELRSANVDAVDDLELIVIYKTALEPILRARPIIAEALAVLVAERQSMLKDIVDEHAVGREMTPSESNLRTDILKRIRGFFAIQD